MPPELLTPSISASSESPPVNVPIVFAYSTERPCSEAATAVYQGACFGVVAAPGPPLPAEVATKIPALRADK